jgi:hypothetical protein
MANGYNSKIIYLGDFCVSQLAVFVTGHFFIVFFCKKNMVTIFNLLFFYLKPLRPTALKNQIFQNYFRISQNGQK